MNKEQFKNINKITVEIDHSGKYSTLVFKDNLGFGINKETADILISCLEQHKKAIDSDCINISQLKNPAE
jgi:hypothetical protein